MTRRSATLTLVLAALAACAHGAEPFRLRVLCYNIHRGEGVDGKLDLERIARVIQSVSPDVVALQEVDRGTQRTRRIDQPAELARLTKMHVVFEKNIDFEGGQYGNAVLSRFPIARHKNVHLPSFDSGEQRGVLICELNPARLEHSIVFACTHLDHRRDGRERLASAERINELLSPHDSPAILAGDLNATRDSVVLRTLSERWRISNDEELPTVPVALPNRQIDFILHRPSDRWKTIETRVLDERVASDHRPIFAVLELASEAKTGGDEPLIASISKETLWRNRDGAGRTWFHPRACMIPGPNGNPRALMTLQEIGGSDYFGPVHWSASDDLGKTWSDPQPIPALGRDPVPGRGDGLMAAVCDVTPQYHPQTATVIALGHVVFYKGDYFARDEQLPRYPIYVTRGQDGTWSQRKVLQWDDPRGSFIYTNNCGQRVVLPGGDVQMSFTFGPQEQHRMVAGVRAAFDGEQLTIREVGPPLRHPQGRGLLEPSVARFGDKFWITMRAEDNRGYVSVSDDGLNWGEKRAWAWEDGTPLEMSTTQQHWLTHSDGLFLVYTRKDESNENVIRWRSPLWVARVDVDRQCLIKGTEQLVLPLVGDGINDPDQVALMGNFNVTHAGPNESWVTVGEWLPRGGYRGDVLLARIRWSKPNLLPLW